MIYTYSYIKDGWIKTYDSKRLKSLQLTKEEHTKTFWMLRDPYELLIELGYTISENHANLLEMYIEGKWTDTCYWFTAACLDKSMGNDIVKFMIGPLRELMNENDIVKLSYFKLSFHAIDFGLLVKAINDKIITAAMGKDILRRMYGGELLDNLLQDEKYKVTSENDVMVFINAAIEANPDQVNDLKAGKDKLLMWLVGQVMKASKGKANATNVKDTLISVLELNL